MSKFSGYYTLIVNAVLEHAFIKLIKTFFKSIC